MLHKITSLLHRRHTRQEFDDEVNQHINLLADRFTRQGMSPDEALQAARRQFGNVTALKEVHHEMQTSVWLETFWQDLRYAVRSLANNRGFTTIAVLTLALGIGANTAIFSVVNATLLRSLPFPDPGRLVVLWGTVKRVVVERRGESYPDFRDWRDQNHSFDAMAAFDSAAFALTGIAPPERISGEYVSQPYFPLLGIHAALGRTFAPDEDRVPKRDAVAVLSDGLWRRRFGADPHIVGRSIELNGSAYTVIGVAPAGFQGLTDEAEIWVPFAMSGTAEELNQRGNRGFIAVARLKPAVSLRQAQTEMDHISRRLARAYPETNEGRAVELTPLDREIFGDFRKPLLVLLAAVAFVLLIAVTNVANLLLARSDARLHDVAMRLALGASRGRLIRQLLTESGVLVACGCATGLTLAQYGTRALVTASPLKFPSFVHPAIDGAVALFTMAVCSMVMLVVGLAPALQTKSLKPGESLKQSSTRTTAGGGSRMRDALVVSEVSFSLLLLIGAGLMLRTLWSLEAVDPGFDPSHLIRLRVSLPRIQPTSASDSAPDAKTVAASDAILNRIKALASVQSASVASDAPLSGEENATIYTAENQPLVNASNMPRIFYHRVSADFFRTIRARFVAGRSFSEDEVHRGADVAIVTENMVRRFWPGQDPLQKRVRLGTAKSSNRKWLAIVGVVEDLNYRGLPRNPTADPDLFQVFNERSRDFTILVRTALPPSAMISEIRKGLLQVDPSILMYRVGTMDELVGRQTATPRFTGSLLAVFACVALVLAMIGIYGVLSYRVSRQTREIGVRMALGARRGQVLAMVAGRGMLLVVAGLVLGAAAALLLTRAMAALVYDVTPTDPATFLTAAVVLAFIAVLACIVPASRASRIDPVIALRNE